MSHAEQSGDTEGTSIELSPLKLSTFSALVNEAFVVHGEDGQVVDLILTEAVALKHHPGAPREDPFSLLFRGPVDFSLPQGNYRITNQTIGELQVFLVPMQPTSEGSFSEAVFN